MGDKEGWMELADLYVQMNKWEEHALINTPVGSSDMILAIYIIQLLKGSVLSGRAHFI